MKRITLLLSFILCFMYSSWAQGLEVADISESIRDLYARTHPRKDDSQENCAVLRIAVASFSDLSFGGKVVGKVDYTPGEYIVYIPAKTKRITVRQRDINLCTIDFEAVGIEIESLKTYKIVLTPPQKKDVIFLISPREAQLFVSGNSVIVDDRGTATYQCEVGRIYKYMVSCPGYERVDGSIMMEENDPTLIIPIDLTKTLSPVFFKYNVRKPKLFVDEEESPSPERVFLPFGMHNIRVIANKHYDLEFPLEVKENMELVQCNLQKIEKKTRDVSRRLRNRYALHVGAGLSMTDMKIPHDQDDIEQLFDNDDNCYYYSLKFDIEHYFNRYNSFLTALEVQFTNIEDEVSDGNQTFFNLPLLYNLSFPLGRFNRNFINVAVGPVGGIHYCTSEYEDEDSDLLFYTGFRVTTRLIINHVVFSVEGNYHSYDTDIYSYGAAASIGWRF